jgi:hypothetical protein
MNEPHRVHTCRSGALTLFLPYPDWIAAEAFPWSCVRTGTPRALETTDACHECPDWQSRSGPPPKPDGPPHGRRRAGRTVLA